jgi:hypothetical protein
LKMGQGGTRVPPFEIKAWMDRPTELAGGSPVAAAPAPDVTTSSASGADDDVSFEI